MDTQKALALKKNYDSLMTLCQAIDNNGLWDKNGGDVALSTVFRADIAQFMLYLSAADGALSEEELHLFRTVTGFTESADDLMQLIKDCKLDSYGFAARVPFSVQVVTEIEANLLSRGVKLHPQQSVQSVFIGFFDGLGEIMVASDNEVAPTERAKLLLYKNSLMAYMQDNNNERYYENG